MNRETLLMYRDLALLGHKILSYSEYKFLFPHGLAWGNRLRGKAVSCTSHRRRMFFRKTRWKGVSEETLHWWDASIT